ncbi:MAG: DNA gyrase modulator, partial [Chloroflexota bacterium]|nr:DNA gyrase modulator [Chloroflexota bacterium]
MEELLGQARKVCQEAEAFSVSNLSTQAVFEANRLKQVQTKESTGTALRLIKDGRIGFAATNRVGGEQDLIAMALEMAPFGAEAKFEFPGAQSYPQVSVFDPAVQSVTEETMVDLGMALIERIKQADPEIVCEGEVSRRISQIEIVNSVGGRV